jgi:hypothetical protein
MYNLKSGRLLLWISISLIFSLTALFDLAGPNPTSRFALVKTFSLEGVTWFPEEWTSSLWMKPDFAQINTKFFSDKSPGLSLLFIPVYLIVNFILSNAVGLTSSYMNFTRIDELFVNIAQLILSFVNAWGVVRFFDITRKFNFPTRFALISSLIFAFSSLFFVYASVFLPHAIIATVLLEIFYRLLLIQNQEKRFSNSLIVGLLLGLGSLLDYVVLFVIPVCCLYVIIPIQTEKNTVSQYNFRNRFLTYFKEVLLSKNLISRVLLSLVILVFAFIGFLPFFIYNYISFGNFTTTAYHVSHWYSKLNFYTSFEDGINIIILAKFEGIIYLTPIIILAFLGFYYFAKEFRKEFLFSFTVFWIFLYFFAKYFTPYGGLYGPRYILPGIPFLFFGVIFFLYKIRHNRILITSSSILIFISVLNNILSMWISKHSPFWVFSNNNPIFDLSLPNFLRFIEGDKEWFRSGIYRFNPLLFLLILLIAMIIIILLIRKSENLFSPEKHSNYILKDERIITEINIWFLFTIFVFTSTFLYQISIILSSGYNETIIEEIGPYFWTFIGDRPPAVFYDVSLSELIFLVICIVLIIYYAKKLIKINLNKEEIRSKI